MRTRSSILSLVISLLSVAVLAFLLPRQSAVGEAMAAAALPTDWRSGGPYLADGGVMTSTVVLDVAASPAYADDHTLFAATRSGVFRTLDGGASWQLLLPLPLDSAAVYFSHVRLSTGYATDGIVLAAYADTPADASILYQSSDAGISWQPLATLTATVRSLVLSPAFATDHTLFALIGDGTDLHKSTDGGQSWQINHIGPEDIFNGFSLIVSPAYATDHTLFATGYGTVHRSTDGGATWSALETYGITFGLALSPDYGTDQSVWATYRLIESPGDGTPENSVMRSFDGGASWTPTAIGLPGNYEPFVRSLAVSPNYATDQSLFTALSGQLLASPDRELFRSYDRGASWVDLGAPPANPDIFALTVTDTPTEGLVAHVATAQGVWHYSNPCEQYVVNHRFEYASGWTFPVTTYPAGYSTARAHDGLRSVRTGIVEPADNRLSYSSVQQLVTIPRDALTVTLSIWWNAVSEEGDLASDIAATESATESMASISGDRQYVVLLDEVNRVIERLLWTRRAIGAWEPLTFDVSAYAGTTMRLHLGVYNDGLGGVTAMFVDDVTVSATCASCSLYLPLVCHELTPAPTVTATATPTASPPPAVTPIWPAPATAIEIFSPLPNERYRTPLDVNGFARTFEGNVYLTLTAADGTLLAEHRTRASMTDFAFFHGYLRFEVREETMATLAVYEAAAADQPPMTLVAVPLRLEPGQRLIDLNSPASGSRICGRVPVGGYSNTFEANVVVELTARDGALIEGAYTLGGNLGIYREFADYFDYTVATPQAALIGAYEVSPHDGVLIDHSRVPVSLYPAGGSTCP